MKITFSLYGFCWLLLATATMLMAGCGKKETVTPVDTAVAFTVNGSYNGSLNYQGLNNRPVVVLNFSNAVDPSTLGAHITLRDNAANTIAINTTINSNVQVTVTPAANLAAFTQYSLEVAQGIKSNTGGRLVNPVTIQLKTGIDSTDKFTRVSDDALLDIVQRQTFKYFWDFAHPVSGLARERNTSNNTVTTGGSGFGIMALVSGVHRQYITRAQGLGRLQTIVGFLKNTAAKFHGAFPHWLHGSTGAVVPFSSNDDGADLVETAFLMEGLLTAREYFNGADAAEVQLRADITGLYNNVEWDWFRKGGENVLYWHWSPNFSWTKNLQIKGWNESLIVYVLAAGSPTHSIPKAVYDIGWATNGAMRNGNNYYSTFLPLGPPLGGPLFFEHYSFLAINPFGLSDAWANYETQVKNHTLINQRYCAANPKGYYGYSSQCWGLTASDIPGGYTASSPNNDVGVIAPTAAISSLPFTPTESMAALKFFYYTLGDRLFKEYGFTDAFSLHQGWFATSFLAIDQGPQVAMIENHRSKLLWNLGMNCPEIKNGLTKLGFSWP